MSELSEELKYWRCERPSEYKMDDFIRSVEKLEKENTALKTLKAQINRHCMGVEEDTILEMIRIFNANGEGK